MFSKEIKIKLNFDDVSTVRGPSAKLQKLRSTENTKIPQKIDKVVSDTDLKAVNALHYLYSKNFNEQTLTQLLSIGVLGLKKNRKLVC